MSKVTVTKEYNLPEDQDIFEIDLKSQELANIVSDIADFLRNKLKYQELTEEQYKCFEEVRNELIDLEQKYFNPPY